MILNIHSLTGEEHVIDVKPSDKIAKVKATLEELSGTPLIQQRLLYQGKKMHDDNTVDYYRIKAGSTVQLVIALRGGKIISWYS